MSLSTFCEKYRSKNEKLLKNITVLALIVSGVVHIGGAIALFWLNKSNTENVAQKPPEPIEFQVIEPEPEPEIAKITPEPEPIVEPEPEPVPEQVQEARISTKQFLPEPIPEPAAPQPQPMNPSPSSSSPQQIPLGTPGGQSLGGVLTGTQGTGAGTSGQGNSQGGPIGSPNGSGTGNSQGTGDGNGQGASWISLKCLSNCQPRYPSSISQKVPGRVIVQFKVESDGSVSNAQVLESSGNNILDQAAVSAISKMKFSPPSDGRSRKAKMPIAYNVN